MLELFSLIRVVRDVSRDVRRKVETDRTVYFYQSHSAVQVEAEQLSKHHVVLLREEGADQLSAERTGYSSPSTSVLGAQVVFLYASDFGLDGHYLRRERIIIVTIVKFRWIIQVYLKDETLFLLSFHPMIKYAKVDDGYAAVRVVYKQFHFTPLVSTNPLEIAIWHLLRHGPAV